MLLRVDYSNTALPRSAPVLEQQPEEPALSAADVAAADRVASSYKDLDALSAKVAEFQRTRSSALRDEIVAACMPLLDKSAAILLRGLAHSSMIDASDLVSYGYLGLEKSLLKFDPARGIKFSTFVSHRVRGGMLDGLREVDPATRLTRIKQSRIDAFIQSERERGNLKPSDENICAGLGITPRELAEHRASLRTVDTRSLDALHEQDTDSPTELLGAIADPRAESALEQAQRDEFWQYIKRGFDEVDRAIITQYCQGGYSMREVGDMLELTESRVCQRATAIANRLRAEFAKSPKNVPFLSDLVGRLLGAGPASAEASILFHDEVAPTDEQLEAAGFSPLPSSNGTGMLLAPVTPLSSRAAADAISRVATAEVHFVDGGEADPNAPFNSTAVTESLRGTLIASNPLPEGARPGNAPILPAVFIDATAQPSRPEVTQLISISEISLHPHNPRVSLSAASIGELAASLLSEGGIHEPLEIVRCRENGVWYIIGGARRFLAAQQVGYSHVPCHVDPSPRTSAEILYALLADNQGHKKPLPLDLARSYQAYMELSGLALVECARALSVKPTVMSRLLSLLALPTQVQKLVDSGSLSESAGELLARSGRGEREVRALAQQAAEQGLGLRALEALLRPDKPSLERGSGSARVSGVGVVGQLGQTEFWIGGEAAVQISLDIKGNAKASRGEVAQLLWAAVRAAAEHTPRSRQIRQEDQSAASDPAKKGAALVALSDVSDLLQKAPQACAELAKIFGPQVFVQRDGTWFVTEEASRALRQSFDARGFRRLGMHVSKETFRLISDLEGGALRLPERIPFASVLALWGANLAAVQGRDGQKFYESQLASFDSDRAAGVTGSVLRQDILPRLKAAHVAYSTHLISLADTQLAATRVAQSGVASAALASEREIIAAGIPLDSRLKAKYFAWQKETIPGAGIQNAPPQWSREGLRAFFLACQTKVMQVAGGNPSARLGTRELASLWLPVEFSGDSSKFFLASALLERFDQLGRQCDRIGEAPAQVEAKQSNAAEGSSTEDKVLSILGKVQAPSIALEARELPAHARSGAAPRLGAVYVDGLPHWEASATVQLIESSSIVPHPWNPRKHFSRTELDELKAQIVAADGVLKPILIYAPKEGLLHPLSGHRRLMACLELGFTHVPCRLVPGELDPARVLKALIVTNEQHVLPAPIDLARSYFEYMRLESLSPEQAAKRLGRDPEAFMRELSLLSLPEAVQALVNEGKIAENIAFELARHRGSSEEIQALASRIVDKGMTLKALRFAVEQSRPRAVAQVVGDRRSQFEFKVKASRQGTVMVTSALRALESSDVSVALQAAFSKAVQQFSPGDVAAVKQVAGGASLGAPTLAAVDPSRTCSLKDLVKWGLKVDQHFEPFYRGWRERSISLGAARAELAMGSFVLGELQEYFTQAQAALAAYVSQPHARSQLRKPKLTELHVYHSRIGNLGYKDEIKDFDIQRELQRNQKIIEKVLKGE